MFKCGYLRLINTFVVGFFLGFILPHYFLPYRESGQLMLHRNEINDDYSEVRRPSFRSQIEEQVNVTGIEDIRKLPTVLCYILTGPSLHNIAIHIKETWGKRCDKLIFFSTGYDEKLPTEVLNVTEGYSHLWQKSKGALKSLVVNYPHYDWYLKADDDTYVIVENLKHFLVDKDSHAPVYYGVKFKTFVKQGYMSGGGGYVLSHEALIRLVRDAFKRREGDDDNCKYNEDTGAEDLHLGLCLESVGVAAGDSLDDKGKPRFFSQGPTSLFFKGTYINSLHWYWKYIWHKHPLGRECCSEYMISFHGIDPRMMWTLEMLLYNIQVHDNANNYTKLTS